mmetsp:Transcript_2864/g.6572  ORF Transcript_2864/g.6572 Transcript_2864/m.6572 type:complete len:330 (+) Transcript_2864:216-1205(+)
MTSTRTSGHKLMSSFSSVFFLKMPKYSDHSSLSPFSSRQVRSNSDAVFGAFDGTFFAFLDRAAATAFWIFSSVFCFGAAGGALVEGGGGGASTATTFLEGEGGFTNEALDGTTASSLTTPFVFFLDKPSLSSIFLLVASRSVVAARSPGAKANKASRSSNEPPKSPNARRATPRRYKALRFFGSALRTSDVSEAQPSKSSRFNRTKARLFLAAALPGHASRAWVYKTSASSKLPSAKALLPAALALSDAAKSPSYWPFSVFADACVVHCSGSRRRRIASMAWRWSSRGVASMAWQGAATVDVDAAKRKFRHRHKQLPSGEPAPPRGPRL